MRGQFESGDDVAALRFVGLSQAQFAKAIGISVHTLRNWEQGRRQLNRHHDREPERSRGANGDLLEENADYRVTFGNLPEGSVDYRAGNGVRMRAYDDCARQSDP